MATTNSIPPLTEQVRQALATFQQAHEGAEAAAAAFADMKRLVGSNEKDRTKVQKETDPELYDKWLYNLARTETEHKAAAAHLERVEKNLNVLRELLQHETASVSRAWAEIADRTAIKYAELQMQPPARVIMHTTHNPDDLPF